MKLPSEIVEEIKKGNNPPLIVKTNKNKYLSEDRQYICSVVVNHEIHPDGSLTRLPNSIYRYCEVGKIYKVQDKQQPLRYDKSIGISIKITMISEYPNFCKVHYVIVED